MMSDSLTSEGNGEEGGVAGDEGEGGVATVSNSSREKAVHGGVGEEGDAMTEEEEMATVTLKRWRETPDQLSLQATHR